jgi:hypothetical protein
MVLHRNRSHVTLQVRSPGDGSLVGYSATRRDDGLLVDILSRTPAEITPVLAATARWLTQHPIDNGPGKPSVHKLKAMETPILRAALAALGFAPYNYKFAFVCNSLDSSLALEAIAPERWYLMPGD